jgi:hypothetical protein
MQELIAGRLEGLYAPMKELGGVLENFKTGSHRAADFNALILNEMEKLDFDDFTADRFGNIIGTMKGYKHEQDMAIIFPIDYVSNTDGMYNVGLGNYTPGIITALYSAAVLKRTLLPLTGDLLV